MHTKLRTSINFNAKVKPLEALNDEFTLCKVWVQGAGKNRNMTYMSVENIKKNISTLFYCPVVGHLIKKEDGGFYMGGHDGSFIVDDDDLKFVSLTVPYGVVCENSYGFEDIIEYGQKVTYLTADAILWTGRYPELKEAIYSEDIYFNQSMEINVEQYRPLEEDSNYMELLEWTYSALCLLGKSDDKGSEEHTEPCFINSRIEPYQFSLTEDFTKAFEEMKTQISNCFVNTNYEEGGKGQLQQQETRENVFMEEQLDSEKEIVEENPELECSSSEGDADQGLEDQFDFKSEYLKLKDEFDILQQKFSEYKETHSYENQEVEDLIRFKSQTLEESHNAEIESALQEFNDLADNEEFVALKERATEFENVEDLKKECYAIRGKAISVFSAKSNKKDLIKIPIQEKSENDEPYGGLFSMFLKK